MQNATLTKDHKLQITPANTSSIHDFDFLEGFWQVENRKLQTRLQNAQDWIHFPSQLRMRKTLIGNVENYYATFNGEAFEGLAIRLFDPKTQLWKVYWMDSGNPKMDENPVTGSFENGLGCFYALDTFNNQPIVILYQWDARNPNEPIWSQAFSVDNGATWEWNWEMIFTKID